MLPVQRPVKSDPDIDAEDNMSRGRGTNLPLDFVFTRDLLGIVFYFLKFYLAFPYKTWKPRASNLIMFT